MKRIFAILLCLLFPVHALAFSGAIQAVLSAGGGVSCASCNSSNDSVIFQSENGGNGDSSLWANWYSQPFTIAAGKCVTGVTFRAWDSGSNNSLVMEIFTNNSGAPGSRVGDGYTVSVSEANVPNTDSGETQYLFAATQTLPAGSYWIVAKTSALMNYRFDNAGQTLGKVSSNSGSSWAANSDHGFIMSVLGCNPS